MAAALLSLGMAHVFRCWSAPGYRRQLLPVVLSGMVLGAVICYLLDSLIRTGPYSAQFSPGLIPSALLLFGVALMFPKGE